MRVVRKNGDEYTDLNGRTQQPRIGDRRSRTEDRRSKIAMSGVLLLSSIFYLRSSILDELTGDSPDVLITRASDRSDCENVVLGNDARERTDRGCFDREKSC